MTRRNGFLHFLLILTMTAVAHAQATRTWVSGVGDDANPCSRTAPGKTFAGALSKTAAGGEINTLDPGGYGAVTITKAIQIDGSGTMASVLVSGTNGIVVAADSDDVIILRNLDIQGLGTGLAGVSFLSGKALILEHCRIANFATGVNVAPTNNAYVTLKDCTVINSSANGLSVAPTGSASVNVSIIRTSIVGSGGTAVSANTGSWVALSNCTVTNNHVGATTLGTGRTTLFGTEVSFNQTGLQVTGGSMHISECMVIGNTTTIQKTSGTLYTWDNNTITGVPNTGATSHILQ